MANGKLKEAERVVRKAAKLNKLSFDDVIKTVREKMEQGIPMNNENVKVIRCIELNEKDKEVIIREEMENGTATENRVELIQTIGNVYQYKVKNYSMLTILKEKRILFNSVVIWICW